MFDITVYIAMLGIIFSQLSTARDCRVQLHDYDLIKQDIRWKTQKRKIANRIKITVDRHLSPGFCHLAKNNEFALRLHYWFYGTRNSPHHEMRIVERDMTYIVLSVYLRTLRLTNPITFAVTTLYIGHWIK